MTMPDLELVELTTILGTEDGEDSLERDLSSLERYDEGEPGIIAPLLADDDED